MSIHSTTVGLPELALAAVAAGVGWPLPRPLPKVKESTGLSSNPSHRDLVPAWMR